jgi:hypothetical protein
MKLSAVKSFIYEVLEIKWKSSLNLSPRDVAWWQRAWDLYNRSRVWVMTCTSCKSLGQPGLYSLIWAHKIRFPGGEVSSNPKKKKIFLEPTWAAIKINFYLNGWRTSPIMKNSWVTEAKELKKKRNHFNLKYILSHSKITCVLNIQIPFLKKSYPQFSPFLLFSCSGWTAIHCMLTCRKLQD